MISHVNLISFTLINPFKVTDFLPVISFILKSFISKNIHKVGQF